MSEYNEPWSVKYGGEFGNDEIYDRNEKNIYRSSDWQENMEHIVACVNALARQEPEKVKKKLELYEEMKNVIAALLNICPCDTEDDDRLITYTGNLLKQAEEL